LEGIYTGLATYLEIINTSSLWVSDPDPLEIVFTEAMENERGRNTVLSIVPADCTPFTRGGRI
jgi:hypothetical protein